MSRGIYGVFSVTSETATSSVESGHSTSPDPNQKTIPVTSQCSTSSSKINPLVSSNRNLLHQHTRLYESSPSNPSLPPSNERTVSMPPQLPHTDTFYTNFLRRDILRRQGSGRLVGD